MQGLRSLLMGLCRMDRGIRLLLLVGVPFFVIVPCLALPCVVLVVAAQRMVECIAYLSLFTNSDM